MKSFALVLLLVGLAAADVYKYALDRQVEDVLRAFEEGMQDAGHLKDALGEESEAVDEVEKEVKKSLLDHLKAGLAEIADLAKDKLNDHTGRAKELVKIVEETVEKLKNLHVDLTDKAKDFVKNVVDRANERLRPYLDRLRDFLGGREKRSLTHDEFNQLEAEVLRFHVLQQTLESLAHQHRSQRSLEGLRNVRDAIVEHLNKLGVHVTDAYNQLVDYLSKLWQKGWEKAREHHENLKDVAREVIEHAKDMSREALREALDILRPKKEELGQIWNELVDSVRAALKGEKRK